MTSGRAPLPTLVEATPPLPPAYDAVVRAGLVALDLDLAPAARAAIDGHLRLLLAWTRAINLTAVREPIAAASAHVVDSLSAVATLRRLGIDRFVDLGSGGGLPGIPLAAALPARAAMLVEPIGKKARFLATAVDATGLEGRVRVAATRAETLAADPRHREAWPGVTARAVAATAELVELAVPLLQPGGRLVAWKRGDLEAELATAAIALEALGGGTIEVLDVAAGIAGLDGHRLVVVARSDRPVPARFPRDPAVRRRQPW